VECGAYDGETSSNSLPLEYNRQWTGVLIEPNPYYYTQILGKSRNVWSLNACLSPYNYAIEVSDLSATLDLGYLYVEQWCTIIFGHWPLIGF